MKRIAKLIQNIKQGTGSPFNVTRVDIVEQSSQWPRLIRSVALTKEDDGSISVRFAGEGRTAERFVEIAKGILRNYDIADSSDPEVAFVIKPKNKPSQPPTEPSEG